MAARRALAREEFRLSSDYSPDPPGFPGQPTWEPVAVSPLVGSAFLFGVDSAVYRTSLLPPPTIPTPSATSSPSGYGSARGRTGPP